MTLWHIIRFTTIRHLRLTEIWSHLRGWQAGYKPKYLRDEWVAVKQRNAVAWDPNELHRFLIGDKMESNQMVHQDHKGQG